MTDSSREAFYVRAFAAGRMASVVGSQIVSIAVGWELYERTRSAWALGVVGLVEFLPVLFLMFAAGAAADRHPRRRVGMLAHTLLALVAAALALVSFTRAPLPLTYALLIGVGVGRAFSSPSVGTILPQLLPPERFARVNAVLASTYELASIGGPAIGGGLVAWTGRPWVAYLVAAVAQGVFVGSLFLLPARPAARTDDGGKATKTKSLFAGVAFIRRNPIFLAAITLDLFAVMLGGAVALLPVFTKEILHAGPSALGWLRAAPSLGALLTSAALTRLPPWKSPGRVLLIVVAGFGVATIGFGLSRSLPLSLACLFFTGVFDAVSVVIRMTLEQALTPDALRGRVSAVNFVFIGFSNELGAFESGATAAWFGPVASVVGGGIGTLAVVAVVALVWPALLRIGPLATLRPAEDAA